MAETNKIEYPIDSIVFENEQKPKDDKQVTLWDIFRNPRLCKRLIIIFFNWLVNSATYYGLSWNVSSLGNNIFLDYFILGIVEIPANLSLLLLLNKFGRQKTLCGYMLIAGAALLITAFFSNFALKSIPKTWIMGDDYWGLVEQLRKILFRFGHQKEIGGKTHPH